MERELNVTELCDAGNTPHFAVWSNRYGKLPPAKPGNGKRGSARYSLCQAIGIRLARLLDAKFGVAPADLVELTSRLWNMGTAELVAEFKARRTCIVVVGRKVCDTFFPPEAVNDFDRYLKSHGAKAVEVFAISVEHEWNRMLERLTPAELRPEPEVN
jgi:hypothetical protein